MPTPAPPLRPHVATEPDEAAARRALKAQIARLEAEAGAQRAKPLVAHPGGFAASLSAPVAPPPRGRPSPRLLSLGELEVERDALAERIRAERVAADRLGERQAGFRALREEILLDPAAHPLARVSNADIGEPGCHDWHVRPRFGLLGMLMRWWRVIVSSGCP